MKYVFSLLLMVASVYASFFEFSKYEDLFLVWAIISLPVGMVGVIGVSLCKKIEDLGDIGKDGIIGIYFNIANIVWLVIWSKVILNGGFWMGFAGVTSIVLCFMIHSIAKTQRKELKESADA